MTPTDPRIIEQQHDTVILHTFPDGRQVAFLQRRETAIANPLTGERRFITEQPVYHSIEGIPIDLTKYTICMCCGAQPIALSQTCTRCNRPVCKSCIHDGICRSCAPAWKRLFRWLKKP